MKRRFPNPRDLAPLMKFKQPQFNAKKRRLASALTIYDLREIAKRRTPQAPFDYTDGAAEGEISLARARQAFEDIEFHPSILRDVSTVDTDRADSRRPVGAAVRDRADRLHPDDAVRGRDRRGAAAAAAAGIPFSLSTMGTTSIEDVAGGEPERPQLVPALHVEGPRALDGAGRPRGGRPASTRCWSPSTCRWPGARLRDVRNGMTIPPTLTPKHGPQRDPAAGLVVQLPRPPSRSRSPRWTAGPAPSPS